MIFDIGKRLAETLTLLGLLGGMSYAVAGDTIVPATRAYVRQETTSLRDIQIDIANGKLEATRRDLKRLELDYLRASSEFERVQNRQSQRDAQEIIDRLKDQLKTLNSR